MRSQPQLSESSTEFFISLLGIFYFQCHRHHQPEQVQLRLISKREVKEIGHVSTQRPLPIQLIGTTIFTFLQLSERSILFHD